MTSTWNDSSRQEENSERQEGRNRAWVSGRLLRRRPVTVSQCKGSPRITRVELEVGSVRIRNVERVRLDGRGFEGVLGHATY